MARLRALIGRGLDGTAVLWPDIDRTYGWVRRAAYILGNAVGEDVGTVRRRFDGLIGSMARHCTEAGSLIGAVAHFLKVTRSYRCVSAWKKDPVRGVIGVQKGPLC